MPDKTNIRKKIDVAKQRSPCPIASTLEIIGDKWTLLIIRDLISGKQRYGELESSPEKIPTNILASRLKLLMENGLISKVPYQERPPRYEYTLTDTGRELTPILKQLEKWGLKNIKNTNAYIKI